MTSKQDDLDVQKVSLEKSPIHHCIINQGSLIVYYLLMTEPADDYHYNTSLPTSLAQDTLIMQHYIDATWFLRRAMHSLDQYDTDNDCTKVTCF